jgi:hypothetical protein
VCKFTHTQTHTHNCSPVKGAQVSATIAMATVVHTRFWRSWTFKLFRSVTSTSYIHRSSTEA